MDLDPALEQDAKTEKTTHRNGRVSGPAGKRGYPGHGGKRPCYPAGLPLMLSNRGQRESGRNQRVWKASEEPSNIPNLKSLVILCITTALLTLMLAACGGDLTPESREPQDPGTDRSGPTSTIQNAKAVPTPELLPTSPTRLADLGASTLELEPTPEA